MWLAVPGSARTADLGIWSLFFCVFASLQQGGAGPKLREPSDSSAFLYTLTPLFLPEEQVFQKKGQGTSYPQNESSLR